MRKQRPEDRHPAARASRGVTLAVSLAALTICLDPPAAPAQQAGDPADASAHSPDPVEVQLERLSDGSLARQQRVEAADRIIRLAADAEPATRVAEAMAGAAGLAPDALEMLLDRVRVADRPPSALAAGLISLAQDVPGEALPRKIEPLLFDAMARYRSQEIVSALIGALERAPIPERREPIVRALVSITGRDDLGREPEAWAAWFGTNRWVGELDWQREVAAGLARQRDRIAAERRAVVDRLIQLSRTMYLTLEPGAERSARLAELLLDREPAIRQLGFDLARREMLAASGTLDKRVGAAAVELLDCEEPGVRAQAASLVVQLAPPEAAEEITGALARETSPHAAAAMLAGVSRWPMRTATGPVVAWLKRADDATQAPAEAAALATLQAGLLDAADLGACVEALRDRGVRRLTPQGLRLLASAGTDHDRDAIANLLDSDDHALRRAAAETLAERPEYLDKILAAATEDPALFRAAADAVLRHRPSTPGFEAVASLPASDAQAKEQALLRLARSLAPQDLYLVADQTPDPLLRRQLLTHLLDRAPDADAAAAPCLLLLAETELLLGQPARALGALERVAAEAEQIDPARLDDARATALLATGQLEAAEAIETTVQAWITALELSVEAEHAPRLLARLRERFDGNIDAERAALIDGLAALIDARHRDAGEEVSDAGSDSPPDGG